MSGFIAIEADADAVALEQETLELLEAKFEGWSPAEGSLSVWLVKAFSRIGSDISGLVSEITTGAFRAFGASVVGVPPILAAPATVESTWTMVDNAGYTIPQGTQVAIESTGDLSAGFITAEEAVVAPGSTTASILLEAVEAGEAGNGLSADPKLIDALAYVATIELSGVTANGVDEEEEDAYLDRLVETLQLLSLSLIVGRDFAIDARGEAGVERAIAIEAYNAETSTEEPLAVSVYGVDEGGAKLSSELKAALKTRQEAKVPSGVDVYVGDPSYQKVKVKAQFKVLSGFDPEAVEAAVTARLTEYLSPANWGLPAQGDPSGSGGWENRTTVYRFELISEVDRVAGVDRVSLLELAKEGSGFGTSDISMTGKVTLTEAGTLTAEAV